MSLDVVVVTYNSAAHLRAALAGLPPEARVVVVDNASTDDSVAIARELGAEVVENPVNAGFGAAANIGIRRGDADHVLLLNPDAVVTPELVRSLVDRLIAEPDLAVVSPRLRHHDGIEQRVRWPFPSAAGAWREALGLHRLLPSAGHDSDGFVIGACFLVRREAFDSVNGFDERIWLYGEESELCRRLVDAAWGIAVADDLEARHVGGASGAGVEDLVFEHFERGGEHNVAIHDGRRSLMSYRLANLMGAVGRSWLPGRGDLHRRRARRVAAVLARRPAEVALDSPATGARGEGLVVCSLEAWDEIWRRNQFLVRELLVRDPNRRVLFVEPPFDRVHELRRGSGRRHQRGLRPLDGDGRIVRVEPVKWLPRALGGAADRSLRRQVRHAARELGLREPTLWVNDPHYAGLATETGWSSLYDITDDWTEAGDGGRATEGVRRAEARLFDECGSVVVCSEGLAATRRSARPDLVVIPNAVDLDHFTRPRPRPDDLPAGPVAVYVGTLHEDRLDVALIERLALEIHDLTVVLVGPSSLSAESTARLGARANAVLVGPRPYSDVPGYLQHADVVIVPHVVSAFTESLDPIKAYECVAVGRPTVATPVAGFRDLGRPVTCAAGDDFIEAVRQVVAAGWVESEPTAVASWPDRAVGFEGALAVPHRKIPVRVVYVDHCAKLSGAELALVRLLPALIEGGVEAHVILGENGPLESQLAEAGARVEVLPLDEGLAATRRDEVRFGRLGTARAWALVRDVLALRNRLRELQPDLVHTNSLKAAIYGGLAGRLAGLPVVWHIRDRIADDYLPRPAVVLVRLLVRVIPTAIVANSGSTLEGIPAVRSVEMVVVNDPYDPPEGGRSTIAEESQAFTVAMVGRLSPWKGQDVFLRAFARAFGDTQGAEHAVIVGAALFGENEVERGLLDLIDELKLTDRVTMTGFVEDVPRLLAGVDCLVHASVIPEPFGQVVVEGMAAGLAVIATAAGGPAETITDGVDGVLVSPGDAVELSEALRRLASDPEYRAELSAGARRRAADFRSSVVVPEIEQLYRRLL